MTGSTRSTRAVPSASWRLAHAAGRLAACAAALLCTACVVVPRSADVYDPRCRTFVRQVVLETAVIGGFGHCQNEGCASLLAALGLVGAASAVVSGSVAVIGNLVYWAERRGQCPVPPARTPAAEATPGRAPMAPPVVPGIVPLAPPAPASSASTPGG